jgi:hypothetical protein
MPGQLNATDDEMTDRRQGLRDAPLMLVAITFALCIAFLVVLGLQFALG